MANEWFVVVLAIFFTLLLGWAFKALPQERWQFLASVPLSKEASGSWKGANLTYYGLWIANASVVAVALFLALLGAIHVPLRAIFLVAIPILLLGVAGSRIVAQIVEGKSHTFTIAGGSFLCLLAAPWVIWVTNETLGAPGGGLMMPILPSLAAASIAYAFGEGMGRLACISFGCCYGRPISQCSPNLRRWFDRHNFVFLGATKKIAYEGGLAGDKVIPVQAITSSLLILTGLIATLLFLRSAYLAAFSFSLLVAQSWRILSEELRADYRGQRKISVYQFLSFLMIPYVLLLSFLFSIPPPPLPDIQTGLRSLWNPSIILLLEALWIAMFLYYGKSRVTGSTLFFHLFQDRI